MHDLFATTALSVVKVLPAISLIRSTMLPEPLQLPPDPGTTVSVAVCEPSLALAVELGVLPLPLDHLVIQLHGAVAFYDGA